MTHPIAPPDPRRITDDGAELASDPQNDRETLTQDTAANAWLMAAIGLATMLYAIALSGALSGAAAFQ